MCLCVHPSHYKAIPGKLLLVTIIKLGPVTASDMGMHYQLTIMTLAFIRGHTDTNHEDNKCLIISETFEVMPIKFAVKIVLLMVCIIFASLMTLTFTQGHNCISNLTHV